MEKENDLWDLLTPEVLIGGIAVIGGVIGVMCKSIMDNIQSVNNYEDLYFYEIGNVFYHRNNLIKAMYWFKKAIRDKTDYFSLHMLGFIYHKLDDSDSLREVIDILRNNNQQEYVEALEKLL